MQDDNGNAHKHPAPHRGRVAAAALFFCLVFAPAIWIIHHVVNYGLASYACFPGPSPRHTLLPGWEGTWTVLLIIAVIGLGGTAASGLVAWRMWRTTREEVPDMSGQLLEIGEGRTRFMAASGLIASGLIAATIIFETIPLFVVPLCQG